MLIFLDQFIANISRSVYSNDKVFSHAFFRMELDLTHTCNKKGKIRQRHTNNGRKTDIFPKYWNQTYTNTSNQRDEAQQIDK